MSHSPPAFSLRKQLAFYGAYHSNPTNIRIHMACVPFLVWSAYVLGEHSPKPDWLPPIHADFGPYLSFDLHIAAIWAISVELYYFILAPDITLTHLPVAALTLLTATTYAHQPGSLKVAAAVHIFGWLAQFYGHGVHERRAPALLDSLLGAVVLAPLFVHYEALFSLGLCKGVQKDLQNDAAKLKAEFRLKNKETEKD